MTTTTLVKEQSEFRQGVQAGVSIAIGYMPIALAFGLLARDTGLTAYETIMMSVFVFAGAAQYISLNLLLLGTGSFEIILTTFIVNIRHLLMTASLNEKVEPDVSWKKALYAFGVTDETFSVASMKEGTVSTGYMFGLVLISYSSWVVFSGLGHVVGSNLPATLQESMGIALYAMFVGLLVPSLKKSRKIIFLASFAGLFNTILSEFLSTGWAIVLATLLSSVLVEIVTTKRKRGVEHE